MTKQLTSKKSNRSSTAWKNFNVIAVERNGNVFGVYRHQKEAQDATKVSQQEISYSIKGEGRKTSYDLYFFRVPIKNQPIYIKAARVYVLIIESSKDIAIDLLVSNVKINNMELI